MPSKVVALIALCVLSIGPVEAEELTQTNPGELPRVSLMEVLNAVGKKTGQEFIVDRRVDNDLVIGQVEIRRMTYPTLLLVLRNNSLAAVEYDDVVSIIDTSTIRQYPLPLLTDLDDSIHDGQWVTMMVKVENAGATQFVPILRPMLPQQGHMVAHKESNTLTIVDSYGNIKRILKLIRTMDAAAAQ